MLIPINLISFVLSLFVVDRQQRTWRSSQHATLDGSSFGSQFRLQGAEPYQSSPEATWHPRLSWRRRDLAKVEMRQVFEMRGRVLVALVVSSILAFVIVAYVLRCMYRWMSV